MTLKNFIKRTVYILSVLLSLQLYVLLGCGWCMTQNETGQYMKVPIAQWQTLTNDCRTLNSELIEYKKEIQLLKKPSAELLSQLEIAEKMLLQLQTELAEQKKDLTLLSNEAEESKTLLQTLKTQIDKERRTHRRQIWQNRIWVFIGGVVVGYLIK